MSIWKRIEYWYFEDKKRDNPYWWSAWAFTKFSPQNKGLYRTMLRTAKNKKRKSRIIERKIKK